MAFDKRAYNLEYSRYNRQKARESGFCIIVMEKSIPKMHKATRLILANAMKNHYTIKWATFKEIVMRKRRRANDGKQNG